MNSAPSRLVGRILVYVALLLAGLGVVRGHEDLALTEFAQWWGLPAGETRFCRLEVVVLYSDPVWKALWVQRGAATSYLSLDNWSPIPEPGQHVVIEGRVKGGGQTQITDVHLRVLAPKGLPSAEAVNGWWQSDPAVGARWLTISGKVRDWGKGEGTRVTAEIATEGPPVKVWLKGADDQPLFKNVAVLAKDTKVSISGVLVPHHTPGSDTWELWSPGLVTLGEQPPAVPSKTMPAERVVTSFDDLWQVPAEGPASPMRVRMEVTVYYHDAEWRSMWVRSGTRLGYLPLGGMVEKRRLGEPVRIEGWLEPGKGRVVQQPHLVSMGSPETLVAQPAADLGDNLVTYADRFIEVEGYVNHELQQDGGHLKLETIVDGQMVTIWTLREGAQRMPSLAGSWITARGVFCLSADLAGRPTKPEMCVNSVATILAHHRLDDDPRFQRPLLTASEFGRQPPDQPVHVEGTVWAQQPGVSVTIWNGESPMRLNTVQTMRLQVGEPIEAIGFPRQGTDGWELNRALCRRAMKPGRETEKLPRISLAEQLRRLTMEEARRGYPVHLAGVVTWSSPLVDFFFMADSTGGVRVRREEGSPAPALAEEVQVSGVSEAGNFAPVVAASKVQAANSRTLPDPRVVTLEQALTGIEEAQWVAMSGFVRSAKIDSYWQRLEIAGTAGEFSCFLPSSVNVDYLVGAVVRVPGVCSAETNERRQLKGLRMWVPDVSGIVVEEARPEDVFALPARSIGELRQFGTWQTVNRRVRVQGVVVHQAIGRWLQLADGRESVRVLSREVLPVAPGDRVEAVGFPGRDNDRSVLREAVYRKTGTAEEPKPIRLSQRGVDVDADGQVVRLAGTLLDAGPSGVDTRLLVQTDLRVHEVVLEQLVDGAALRWRAGAQIEVVGLYEVKYDELKRPAADRILLRSPADVRVLHPAPWLTAGRAIGVTSVLAAIALAGWFWGLTLRRRVRRQTEQIREQLEKEKAARLDAALARASKLESLGLLAGGIAHDFNNLLTVIMGNLSLARLDQPADSPSIDFLRETEKASLRARDLTQQLLTFAKGGEPVREAAMLPDIVRESASFVLHGSSVRAEFDIAANLWPANVDKGQIGQVVQNIVINARQAMPTGGVIKITLRNTAIEPGTSPELAAGRYLLLQVADNGKGIPPEIMPRIFEPYFTTRSQGNGLGLATVFSIVKKHLGHITVDSAMGEGTRFRIWLPAAATDPVSSPAVVEPLLRPLSGRVLFLDDEAPIRAMATSLLTRMGLAVKAVADGQEVVDEYARAAQGGAPYDLVILDLTIPGGLGGAEAMAELRRTDPNVLAIVSSGYSSNSVLANYRDYGFRAMVAKPYDFAELAQAIQRVLATRPSPGA